MLIGSFLILFGRYVVNGDLAKHSVVGRSTIWVVFGLVICCLAVSYEEIVDTGSASNLRRPSVLARTLTGSSRGLICYRLQSRRNGLVTSFSTAHHNQTSCHSYRAPLQPSVNPFLPCELRR